MLIAQTGQVCERCPAGTCEALATTCDSKLQWKNVEDKDKEVEMQQPSMQSPDVQTALVVVKRPQNTYSYTHRQTSLP